MTEGKRPLTANDFGALIDSEKFTTAMLKLNTNLDGTNALLDVVAKCDLDKLSVKDQVMFDLYMAYSVNSLYWMFLRTQGINPATHSIKREINRVRECVGRANKVHNRKNPKSLNKEAAKRFIRSGLWTPGQKPAGGVVKKFVPANVEATASSSLNNVNEKSGETRPFKAPNGNTERVGQVKASSSSSKVNEKPVETRPFKAPNGNTERVGQVKASSSSSKVNEKPGETRPFKAPNGNTERLGQGKPSSSLYNSVNKNGGETKHFKAPNEKMNVFKKFNSTNVGAVQAGPYKRGGDTKNLSPFSRIGKDSKYNPYQYRRDKKHKYIAPHLQKGHKTTFPDSL